MKFRHQKVEIFVVVVLFKEGIKKHPLGPTPTPYLEKFKIWTSLFEENKMILFVFHFFSKQLHNFEIGLAAAVF